MSSRAMVGRAAELATVRGLIDAAAASSGTAVMVVGEAGIGKSRLLHEVVERADSAGMVVLASRAVEGGGTYRALAEALLAHLRTTRIVESEEPRPYRAALRRLLPGWVGAADKAPSELAVDPVPVLGEGLLALRRAGRGVSAAAGGPALGRRGHRRARRAPCRRGRWLIGARRGVGA